MATITVRNLSKKVVQKLKEQAKRHGRAMEAEVREILKREVMDRQLLLEMIDAELGGQSEATTPDQVDNWLRRSREHPV